MNWFENLLITPFYLNYFVSHFGTNRYCYREEGFNI